MIVHQIEVMGIPCLETEDDAPVGADGDSPEAFPVMGEGVQAQTRQIDVPYGLSRIEKCEKRRYSRRQPWIDASPIILLEQPSQTLVPETGYHSTPL